MNPRMLVVDANPAGANAALQRAGATPNGQLYVRVLMEMVPGAGCDIVFPAQGQVVFPRGRALSDYHAVVWTGSALSVNDDSPAVANQIELAKTVFAAGLPFFGSCFGLQLVAVAAGGSVRPSPNGQEFGIARGIALTAAGRDHPMFAGHAVESVALCIHRDEVDALPPGAVVLASNQHSPVQAAAIPFANGVFWGVQYHPEYDFHEISRLALRHADSLIRGELFPDQTAVEQFASLCAALHAEPERNDLQQQLALEPSHGLIDPAVRRQVLRNWLDSVVLPYYSQRG